MIRNSVKFSMFLLAVGSGCASYPAPVQRMADAEAATRASQELGANSTPRAQLHMRLAQEETAQAKTLVDQHDNKRADFVLVRANADAELGLALSRQARAEAEAQKAIQQTASSLQPSGGMAATTTTTTTINPAQPAPATAMPNTTTSPAMPNSANASGVSR